MKCKVESQKVNDISRIKSFNITNNYIVYDKTSTLQYNKYTVWKSKIKYHDPKIKQTLRASTSLDKKKTPNDKMIVLLLTGKVIYMKSQSD